MALGAVVPSSVTLKWYCSHLDFITYFQ